MGDRVRIPRLGQTAEVLTAPNDDEEITVRFGLMKMTVPLDDVESLEGEKVAKRQKAEEKREERGERREGLEATQNSSSLNTLLPTPDTQPSAPPAIRTSHNTIDIRGSRVADAEPMIEQAIAQAYDSGVLWIIHGHGTGKLRQGCTRLLAAPSPGRTL